MSFIHKPVLQFEKKQLNRNAWSLTYLKKGFLQKDLNSNTYQCQELSELLGCLIFFIKALMSQYQVKSLESVQTLTHLI